jgi:hypothetical protein
LRALTPFIYAAASPQNLVDIDGRVPKPPDAKDCGSSIWNPDITVPRPGCNQCNGDRVKAAIGNVRGNKEGFCGGGKKCASESELKEKARGGVDENTGKSWYKPQGDACVDYCICVHERDHVLRLFFNPYSDLSCEQLECLASMSQLICLRNFTAGGKP